MEFSSLGKDTIACVKEIRNGNNWVIKFSHLEGDKIFVTECVYKANSYKFPEPSFFATTEEVALIGVRL